MVSIEWLLVCLIHPVIANTNLNYASHVVGQMPGKITSTSCFADALHIVQLTCVSMRWQCNLCCFCAVSLPTYALHIILTWTYRGTYLLSHPTQPRASQHHKAQSVCHYCWFTSHTLASHPSLSVRQMSISVVNCYRSGLCNAGSRTEFTATGQPMYHQSTHPPQPATQPAAQDSVNSLQLPRQAPSSSSSSASSSSGVAGAASCDSRSNAATAPCLFAFPLESNFSGARYDPAVVRQIQISGLAVTPCVCSRGSEQQCSQHAGLHKTNEEEQQSGQQQATQEQQCGQQQQQQHTEEEPPSDQQRQRQTEEEQRCVQQSQAAAKDEENHGQHSKEEALRLRDRASGRSDGHNWYVLIDAAKACATAPPDLTQNPADFVVSQCPLVLQSSSSCECDCSVAISSGYRQISHIHMPGQSVTSLARS